jgi:hypothetical protein
MTDGKWNKFRDDVTHDGHRIDWGKWAITGNDPAFGGTGNPDTGVQCVTHGANSKRLVAYEASRSARWLLKTGCKAATLTACRCYCMLTMQVLQVATTGLQVTWTTPARSCL